MKLKELSDLWRKKGGQEGTGTLCCSTPVSDPTITFKPSTVVAPEGSLHGCVLGGFSPSLAVRAHSSMTQQHRLSPNNLPLAVALPKELHI